MKKKGESSNIKIGLAIILGFVILGIATTMPWLFVILVPIGIGIAIGRINDKLPKQKRLLPVPRRSLFRSIMICAS